MLRLSVREARAPRGVGRSAPRRRLATSNSSLTRTTTSTSTSTAEVLHAAIGLEHLFVHARDALAITDLASGRIMRWNPAAERLFGYPTSEAIGRPIDMLMPASVARLHHEQVAHYTRSGDRDVLRTHAPLSVPAFTRSGDEIRIELSMAPLEVAAKSARCMLFTFRDAGCAQRAELHALRSASAELARDEAEARLRRCQQLLLDTTRDLELPVARARRAAERLARFATTEATSRPQRLACLALVVQRRAEELERAQRHSADAAAIETGTLDLASERVNLVPLVSQLVATARSRAHAHRFKVAAPQGLTTMGDSRRIESVLRDLIEAAVRRNPRGCWIDVELRRPLPGIARIEVRDYGRRASPRERLQFNGQAQDHRSWLVARHIVERHGGSLTVEFPPDGGVRTILTLPTRGGRGPGQAAPSLA